MNYNNGQNPPPPYYPPPVYQPHYEPYAPWVKPIRRNANAVCFGLFLMLLLGIFVLPVFSEASRLIVGRFKIESREVVSAIDILCELFSFCLMLLIPTVIMRLLIGIPPRVAFPLKAPRASLAVSGVFICLGVSVIGSMLYVFIAAFLDYFFGVAPYIPSTPLPKGVAPSIIYIIWVVVSPAVLEELLFRGVIMQSLRRFGDAFALVVSSVLFALAHHNPAQSVSAMLVGLTIGFFVLRTGSIWTGMLIHFVNNAISVAAGYFSRNLPVMENNLFSALQFAFFILSGSACLAYLLTSNNRIFSLAPSAYPLTQGRKLRSFFIAEMPIVYLISIFIIMCVEY